MSTCAPVDCSPAPAGVAAVVAAGESPFARMAHPAFAPIARWLAQSTSPSLVMLNTWARELGIALPDGSRFVPTALLPLPVAALPGWVPDRDYLGERRFDDESVFRPCPRGGFAPTVRLPVAATVTHYRE